MKERVKMQIIGFFINNSKNNNNCNNVNNKDDIDNK